MYGSHALLFVEWDMTGLKELLVKQIFGSNAFVKEAFKIFFHDPLQFLPKISLKKILTKNIFNHFINNFKREHSLHINICPSQIIVVLSKYVYHY